MIELEADGARLALAEAQREEVVALLTKCRYCNGYTTCCHVLHPDRECELCGDYQEGPKT